MSSRDPFLLSVLEVSAALFLFWHRTFLFVCYYWWHLMLLNHMFWTQLIHLVNKQILRKILIIKRLIFWVVCFYKISTSWLQCIQKYYLFFLILQYCGLVSLVYLNYFNRYWVWFRRNSKIKKMNGERNFSRLLEFDRTHLPEHFV